MTHLAGVSLQPPILKRAFAAKAPRDPERPKQPAGPWLRFLGDFREKRKDLKAKETMKAAAVEWKALPDGQKTPWVQPYNIEKEKYNKAFKEYSDSGKLEAWKRDPLKPKKPMTPFLQLAGEIRQKNPNLKMTDASKQASTTWKMMTPEQKAPSEKQYEEANKKYKVAMEEYKTSGKEAAWKEKKGLTAAELKKQKVAAKDKEAKAAMKAKEAAKKLKEKEALAKKKEADAAKKLKLKMAAEAKKAKAKELAAKKKEQKAANAKDAKVPQATAAAAATFVARPPPPPQARAQIA